MTNSIILYKSKIKESENMIIDRIEDYLSGRVEPRRESFTSQYIDTSKIDVSIKINSLTTFNVIDYQDFNYCRIQRLENSKIFYYFIRKIEYISQQCYKVDLHMDVLNTFRNKWESSISQLTHITRQHKDRFKIKTINDVNYYYPHIDEYSEGINAMVFKKYHAPITQSFGEFIASDFKWYLIFKQYSEQIRCFLVPNKKIGYIADNDNTIPDTAIFDDVPLTDGDLIKIIELPYFPIPILQAREVNDMWHIKIDWNRWSITDPFVADSKWTLYTTKIQYGFSNTELLRVELYDLNPLCTQNMNNNAIHKALGQLRNTFISEVWEEPKLYHSDFYYNKYVYDSFSKIVKNESFLNSYYIDYIKYISFYVTNTINSNFMFSFNFFEEYNFNNEDFSKYLMISRNNEVTIYTSAYMEYIKTGYNYDVKNKNRQETMQWVTSGIGLTAGIASLIFGSKTLGAGLISSSVLSIANSISNTIQLESNFSQKQEQLKHQSMAIYGADDVDLMNVYNFNNKLSRARYEVSERMRNLLKDLFYYTGYIDDTIGIPVLNSRMWFNYLQCEIKFENINLNMSKEQLDELINKFKGGVTIYHTNILVDDYVWDFERVRENWERVFFN